jgi:integrase/recombinase XerD
MPVTVGLASDDDPDAGLLDSHLEGFFEECRARGYRARRSQRKRVLRRFASWVRRARIPVDDLSEVHVAQFLLPISSRDRLGRERAVLRRLLQYLRREGVLSKSPTGAVSTPEEELEQSYIRFLREERGLSQNTVNVYQRSVRAFLAEQAARGPGDLPETIDAQAVRAHILARARDGCSDRAKQTATSLRSFLGFLFLRGMKDTDLSVAIPKVMRWSQAGVPAFLSPDEVERVLSTTDRATSIGRRDHAILLLLARLGLRAGEVVTLELSDIHWRGGEVMVRGKGRDHSCLPLLPDVGEALALYLKQDRPPSPSRRVFVRAIPPYVGLTGPAAVGHVVRRALSRAGLRSPSRRGAAHLFRHSLATKMIRNGASMEEIGEVLRHRSRGSTELYAKVDFEALRGVARPWPGTGGSR